MDYSVALISGTDIPIIELKLILHQPKIYEIALIGEEEFLAAIQTLAIDKKTIIKDKNLLEQVDNFQIFIGILLNEDNIKLKQNIFNVLKLIFPNYSVSLHPKGTALLFINRESKESSIVDIHNFSYFQNMINLVFLNQFKKDEIEYNPANKKAEEIAEKIMKSRQKIAEIKKMTGDNLLIARYISILSIGLHLSYDQLLNYTLFQLLDAIKRFNLWLQFDINLKIKLAGGTVQESPEDNWQQNLYKK